MLELFTGGNAQASTKGRGQMSESPGERWAHFYGLEGNQLEVKQLP